MISQELLDDVQKYIDEHYIPNDERMIEMDLIGKKVYITCKENPHFTECGIVKDFDGEHYHITIINSPDQTVILSRNEFIIQRNKKVPKITMQDIQDGIQKYLNERKDD